MFDYLEKLRRKPGHIRERIAFGTAAATTGVVALGWLMVTVSSGTFALSTPEFADTKTANEFGALVEETKTGVTSLLGAVAAFNGDASGITIETVASTTVEDQPTVLPF